MDQEFERRWRAALAPFDGIILRQNVQQPLTELQPSLRAVVEFLGLGRVDQGLCTLDDWHEHDGYVTQPQPISWGALLSIVFTPQTLLRASTGETYVSKGFFPEAREFYFRIYIPDESDLPADRSVRLGEFDLTCSESLADQVVEVVQTAGAIELIREPAKTYFDRMWSG